MTSNMPLPTNLSTSDPAPPFQTRNWAFDHVPALGELLPKHKGRPGFEYLQCAVTNLRRAQDEHWSEVENTMIYVIEGPKGEAHMKLLARGKPIPGQSTDSGARLCLCDKTVEELTGVWINPHQHTEPEVVETAGESIIEPPSGGDTQKSGPSKPTTKDSNVKSS